MAQNSVEWCCQEIDGLIVRSERDFNYVQELFYRKADGLASTEGTALHEVDCILERILDDVEDHLSKSALLVNLLHHGDKSHRSVVSNDTRTADPFPLTPSHPIMFSDVLVVLQDAVVTAESQSPPRDQESYPVADHWAATWTPSRLSARAITLPLRP